jgi:sterol desaturase/sphingolipid hydroxylase (fatty acid hydroxylase superfamily)
MDYRLAILAVYLGFAALEALSGRNRTREITSADWRLDLIAAGLTTAVINPLIILGSGAMLGLVIPAAAGALGHWPVWAMVLALLIGDDLMQYAWHRASHGVPFLYTLHRAHHSARYMSVQMVYRNNLFYYAFMPSMWVSGLLVYLGMGEVYVGYLVVKLSVIAGAHSSVAWDAPLYRVRALRPLMWIVERVISTPSTHHMHHGRHADDGITHYAGNYGNLLFFWDVLFGTARITRRYPASFGIENLSPQPWHVELSWPLARLRDGDAEPRPAKAERAVRRAEVGTRGEC